MMQDCDKEQSKINNQTTLRASYELKPKIRNTISFLETFG